MKIFVPNEMLNMKIYKGAHAINVVFIWLNVHIVEKMMCVIAKKLYPNDFSKICLLLERFRQIDGANDSKLLKILEVAEDKRFLRHPGFDCIAILRAILFFLLKKRLSGASTIDQQLVRTITKEKSLTLNRKIKEIVLASAINVYFKKEIIARLYLDIAYYGWDMIGLKKAIIRLKRENIVGDDEVQYAIVSLLKYPLAKEPSESSIKKVLNRIKYIKNRHVKLRSRLSEEY